MCFLFIEALICKLDIALRGSLVSILSFLPKTIAISFIHRYHINVYKTVPIARHNSGLETLLYEPTYIAPRGTQWRYSGQLLELRVSFCWLKSLTKISRLKSRRTTFWTLYHCLTCLNWPRLLWSRSFCPQRNWRQDIGRNLKRLFRLIIW
jgi:hypothetical protein